MILDYFNQLNKLDENLELEEVFQIHDELNPKLFENDNILKVDVRQRLIEIADMFVKSIREDEVPLNVLDYWLVGSNAQYNYSDSSDIDVHIIVTTEDIECDPYILNLLYTYIKSSFNNKYDILVKGHEVELYIEDVNSTVITNGIYSLMQDKWIKVPTKTEILSYDVTETSEWKEWYQRYSELKDSECEQFLNDLYIMRKASLSQSMGEWDIGNLIFKEFRNQGILDELKDRNYKYKSKELTLENLNNNVLIIDSTISSNNG